MLIDIRNPIPQMPRILSEDTGVPELRDTRSYPYDKRRSFTWPWRRRAVAQATQAPCTKDVCLCRRDCPQA